MEKLTEARKTFLLIDGAYFANRTLHGERIINPEMTMETNHDFMRFEYLMIRNLISTITAFKNDSVDIVDNVILCFDSKSWRYGVKPHVPYYSVPGDLLNYKENRDAQKEKSDIDWEAFRQAQDDFAAMIKDFIPTYKISGFEADDLLFYLTDKLSSDGHRCIVLATDGDLEQLVNDRVVFFKDVRSKRSPNGELFMSENNYNLLFGGQMGAGQTKSMLEMFTDKLSKTEEQISTDMDMINWLGQLNQIQTTGNIYRKITRLPNQQTFIENKHKTMFYKCIEGDKKDNILPLLQWLSSTGTRKYKCTDKFISRVINSLGYPDTNETYRKLFDVDNLDFQFMIKAFMLNLVDECKQMSVAKNLLAHLKHNMKLNLLSHDFLPESLRQDFDEEFDYLELQEPFDIKSFEVELMKKNIGVAGGESSSNTTNILTDSLPDVANILKL